MFTSTLILITVRVLLLLLQCTTAKFLFGLRLTVCTGGTHAECVTNNINSTFAPLATTLRQHHRMAILSETGGGNVASCVQDLCQEIAFLNENSDVYFGYVGWAAGSFDNTYVLDETPVQNANGSWTDTLLVSSCIAR